MKKIEGNSDVRDVFEEETLIALVGVSYMSEKTLAKKYRWVEKSGDGGGGDG